MSYIRSLSNPEHLYIFGTGNGIIEIMEGYKDPLRIPRHVFLGIMRKFLNYDAEEFSYRGATMREIPADWRFELCYKDWDRSVIAHDVTWFYIAQHAKGRK